MNRRTDRQAIPTYGQDRIIEKIITATAKTTLILSEKSWIWIISRYVCPLLYLTYTHTLSIHIQTYLNFNSYPSEWVNSLRQPNQRCPSVHKQRMSSLVAQHKNNNYNNIQQQNTTLEQSTWMLRRRLLPVKLVLYNHRAFLAEFRCVRVCVCVCSP